MAPIFARNQPHWRVNAKHIFRLYGDEGLYP